MTQPIWNSWHGRTMAKAPGNVKTLKNSSPAFFLFQENIPNRPAAKSSNRAWNSACNESDRRSVVFLFAHAD
jgi:hypothetical protein